MLNAIAVRFCRTIQIHDIAASYCCTLVLPATMKRTASSSRCKLLLQTFAAGYCCKRLLHPSAANFYCKRLLQVSFLLSSSGFLEPQLKVLLRDDRTPAIVWTRRERSSRLWSSGFEVGWVQVVELENCAVRFPWRHLRDHVSPGIHVPTSRRRAYFYFVNVLICFDISLRLQCLHMLFF